MTTSMITKMQATKSSRKDDLRRKLKREKKINNGWENEQMFEREKSPDVFKRSSSIQLANIRHHIIVRLFRNH